MTYLEKYKLEHPGLTAEQYLKCVIYTCPHGKSELFISCPKDLRTSGMTNEMRCPICWNREIPGTEPTNNTTNEREDGNMSKKFTKKDLKVGYVVKMRDGSLNMVTINYRDELIMVDKNGGWMGVKNYDEHLCENGNGPFGRGIKRPEYDIMEVYGGCGIHHRALVLDTEDRKLLWKREPEKTCDSCAHKVVCTHVGMCEHYMEKEASK